MAARRGGMDMVFAVAGVMRMVPGVGYALVGVRAKVLRLGG